MNLTNNSHQVTKLRSVGALPQLPLCFHDVLAQGSLDVSATFYGCVVQCMVTEPRIFVCRIRYYVIPWQAHTLP